MSETFSFVFTGRVEPGLDPEEVKSKLAEGFGMPVEKIERIFTGRPVVIKRGLDRAAAERLRQTFAAAGAIGEIRGAADPEPAAEPLPQAAVTPQPLRPAPSIPRPDSTLPSGFWRRLVAFLVDGFIIAIPGWLIGLVFYDRLVRIGQSGRLIGVVIALLYFALLNSSLGKGQTLGKRLLKIRVVDLQGKTIPLHRSTLRYVILWLPFFCNHLMVDSGNLWLAIPLTLIVFGLGGSIVYFFFFNRKNRRTVHDFCAGTLVVKAEPQAAPEFSPTWRGHFAILAVILVGLSIAGAVLIPSQMQKPEFAEILDLQQALQQEPGVHAVGVQYGWTRSGDNTTQWFAVSVNVSDPQVDLEETANHFAKLALTREDQIDQKDLLVVNVSRGYDIGIAANRFTQRFAYPPARWRTKLGVERL